MLELIFSDYTFRIVALGTILLGIASGVLSSFVILNKQALVGDALSHAALPGIILVFMIIKVKNLELLLLGALFFGLIAIGLTNIIKKYSKVKFDSSLALVLSSFFGFGLVLMTIIQKTPTASQAGLNNFIFGQASTMLPHDVYLMLSISILVILLIILFWKELKLFVFNPEFSQALGFNNKYISLLFSGLIVLTVIIGLESVGVILISSLLVAPGVSARQWTNRLSIMVVLSGLFGAISGFFGTIISAISPKMPTGAIIVIVLSVITILSILFGSKRGIIWRQIKNKINNHKIIAYQWLNNSEINSLPIEALQFLTKKNYLAIQNNEYVLTNEGRKLIDYYKEAQE